MRCFVCLLLIPFLVYGCDSLRDPAPARGTTTEAHDDSADHAPPSDDSVSADDSVPWAPGAGATTTVSGRVITPDQVPIAGAAVQLVYPGDPHAPESVAYSKRTGADGTFRFEDVSAYVTFPIVVRHEGSARTYWPSSESHEAVEREAVSIRMAPTRAVKVTMRCTRPGRLPSAIIDDPLIRLNVRWLSEAPTDHPDEVVRTTMPATDGTADPLSGRGESGFSEVLPGWSPYLVPVPADARSFERQLMLPVGRHQLTIDGSCGVLSHEFTVPAEGPVLAVSVSMPP